METRYPYTYTWKAFEKAVVSLEGGEMVWKSIFAKPA